MNNGSLRLRLLAASAVSILLALVLSGFALIKVFESQVSARVERELNNHLLQLAGALETGLDGKLYLARQLADPRFQQPLSGLYWQIVWTEQEPLRSRSLWDESISALPLATSGASRIFHISGPGATPLIALERVVTVLRQNQPYEVRLLVGTDAAEQRARHRTETAGDDDHKSQQGIGRTERRRNIHDQHDDREGEKQVAVRAGGSA